MENKIWTKSNVEDLKIGDEVLNHFGKLAKVTEITFHGIDIKGHAFVGFYQEFGFYGSMSNSITEGERITIIGS